MNPSKFLLPPYIKALAIITLIILILFILITGRSIFIPLFLAGFISVLLSPVAEWMESKKISRTLSTFIALFSSLVVILGFIAFVVSQVASFTKDLEDVGGKLNSYLRAADQLLVNNFKLETGIGNGIDQKYIIDLLQSNSSSISEFVLGTLGSLSGIVLLPVFIFFFLLYRDHLTKFIVKIYKDNDQEKIKREIKDLRKVIQNYIIGMGKVMVILAIMNAAVLLGLGVKHAIFFAAFAAILNIIPYLGPFLGAILPTIYAFLTMDGLFYPIGVLLAFQIIQLIESNFLTPKIVGSNVNLNAFITFIGLLVGASIWGVIGMVLIIPTLAVLRKIFELSESSKPYAFLLGEEINDEKDDLEKL